jgi:hypothetical protein
VRAEIFYPRLIHIMNQLPDVRHSLMSRLHYELLPPYLSALGAISATQAGRITSDGRNLIQMVGHIAEWDRYTILATGEMLAGIATPRMMHLKGYLEADGSAMEFASIDGFNAYQAEKHTRASWEQVQRLAIDTAAILYNLYTNRALMSPEVLEKSAPYEFKLPNNQLITATVGWFQWFVTMEHESVEHAADLAILS